MSEDVLKKPIFDKDFMDGFNKYLEIKTQTPYLLSTLPEALALETWDYRHALLLIVGIEQSAAEVEWLGYENYAGVWIEDPTINNASFLDATLPDYTVPTDFSNKEDKDYFKGDKHIEEKIKLLKDANVRLRYLFKHWESAAKPHSHKNSPSYYIEWALSKKYDIHWLDFVIERGFYKPNQLQEVEKPISDKERKTLLIIIAALAKEAKLDITKISKTGDLIASMTQLIGAPVGATTIETHLKKINQALENRAE